MKRPRSLGIVNLASDPTGEDIVLEAERASDDPLALDHSLDQDLLGGGSGLVVHEMGEEGFELLGIFAIDEFGGSGGEAVR